MGFRDEYVKSMTEKTDLHEEWCPFELFSLFYLHLAKPPSSSLSQSHSPHPHLNYASLD